MTLHIASGPAPAPQGRLIVQHRVACQQAAKQQVVDALGATLRDGWVGPDDEHWLCLCLEELIANAMLHGNQGDPGLCIDVRLYDQGDAWLLMVSDQGPGFNASSLPDANDPASLLLEHGRGIVLMRQWLDDLTYYDGGRTAVLRRTRHGSTPKPLPSEQG